MQIIKNPSPNFSPRNNKINFIIIHYTAMSFEGALKALCNKETKVSSHYLIKASGEIFQLVDDSLAAHHAGISFWKGVSSLNHSSIGIELDNMGNTKFALPQMDKCIELCKKLVTSYNIPKQNIIGHSDIAPNRKIDPGIYFDWKYLAKDNLGIWPGALHEN